MDRMTDEMERLALEVVRLRDARTAFMRHLSGRVAELKRGVQHTQAQVRKTQAEMSHRMRAEAQQFLSRLKGAVEDLEQAASGTRHQFAADMAGAHAAWTGRSAGFNAAAKRNGGARNNGKRKTHRT